MTGEQNEKRQQDIAIALSEVTKTALGRRFLFSLIEDAGVYRSTFDPDPMRMAHAEGERGRGLRLLLLLQREQPEVCDLVLREGAAWARELAHETAKTDAE